MSVLIYWSNYLQQQLNRFYMHYYSELYPDNNIGQLNMNDRKFFLQSLWIIGLIFILVTILAIRFSRILQSLQSLLYLYQQIQHIVTKSLFNKFGFIYLCQRIKKRSYRVCYYRIENKQCLTKMILKNWINICRAFPKNCVTAYNPLTGE